MSILINTSLKNGFYRFTRQAAECKTLFCDTGALRQKDLKALFSRKIDCLVVEGFLQKQMLSTAQRLASGYYKDILNLPKEYVYTGFAAEETVGKSTLRHYYHASAVQGLAKHREESAPSLTWIDKLRLELDEQHPEGARLSNFSGMKHQAYIARAVGSQDESLIRVRDLPVDLKPTSIKSHVVALQFLVAPEKGGELELYPDLLDQEEKRMLFDGNLEILSSTLPKPSESIKPFAGRLVLFNSQIPFRFAKVESRELSKEESKPYLTQEEIKAEKTVTKDISLVTLESFILQHEAAPELTIMR
jgi:hypothetical protein